MTTAVVVGSGPSFTPAQARIIEAARAANRCHVLVVNNKWLALPNADVLYAADAKWWKEYVDAVRAGFTGEMWTQDADSAKRYGLCWVKCRGKPGLSLDRAVVHNGGNSGYQAVNLAYHFGAQRILLAGFDMQHGPNGERHDHPDHPPGWGNANTPELWAKHFPRLHEDLKKAGVELLNCTIRTALTIPRADLATELALA